MSGRWRCGDVGGVGGDGGGGRGDVGTPDVGGLARHVPIGHGGEDAVLPLSQRRLFATGRGRQSSEDGDDDDDENRHSHVSSFFVII